MTKTSIKYERRFLDCFLMIKNTTTTIGMYIEVNCVRINAPESNDNINISRNFKTSKNDNFIRT